MAPLRYDRASTEGSGNVTDSRPVRCAVSLPSCKCLSTRYSSVPLTNPVRQLRLLSSSFYRGKPRHREVK